MTQGLGEYTFLPWLRQGLAQSIDKVDGDQTVKFRATTRVQLKVMGTPIGTGTLEGTPGRDVELYGPGEVIGIDQRLIIRTDPRPWVTDVEPNYLAHVEFYEEDFPWRYTPAKADGLRVRPWLALVVLEDTGDPATSEFTDAKAVADRPLPFIAVKSYTPFPKAEQLWAWAHVHVNGHLTAPGELVAADVPATVQRVADALAANPDRGYSRLVCPRRLRANTGYHAFVVPTFERGRLAGLGEHPDGAPYATASAWESYTDQFEPMHMPYYHRWYFRTGGDGDFESLVRLLDWRTVDAKVGYRDLDVLAPGSNLPKIDDARLGGVLWLGGALRAPKEVLLDDETKARKKYEEWNRNPWPHPFGERLAAFIDLADSFTQQPSGDALTDAGMPPDPAEPATADPLITAPIYGEWQALQHRLLTDRDGNDLANNANWLHELNLDPRYRVAAAFGGDVVRKYQEDYMEAAWRQVGDVLSHNKKVKWAQTLVGINEAIHAKAIEPLLETPSLLLARTAPVQKRIVIDGVTAHYARQQTQAVPALTSPTMRRILRPHGPLAKRLDLRHGRHATDLVEAVNCGPLAAPPKPAPGGAADVEDLGKGQSTFPPQWLIKLAQRWPWLAWLLAVLAVVFVLLAVLVGPAALWWVLAAVCALAALIPFLVRRLPTLDQAFGPDMDRPESVDHLAPGPAFSFGQQGGGSPIGSLTGQDNAEATRFKQALRHWAEFATEAAEVGKIRKVPCLDVPGTSSGVGEALKPGNTVPDRVLGTSEISPHVADPLVEAFDEIKYYPRIDEPMYTPLKALGDEKFVPNLDLIEPNTVVALETNQAFIEAYMVGVNSEFSRELLWREYPTDMRGTYFRQFWDVTPALDPAAPDPDAHRRALYDIPEIHRWPRASTLGQHDNRQPDPNVPKDEIVLVIRGELLKKYPNTVVYAHHARWQPSNDDIDPTRERVLIELEGAELTKPPRDKVRTPIYEAKVDPDIYFFGFDLTGEDVKGEAGDHPGDPAGWFFVLKERPGEPRFGLDSARAANESIVTVNDLAWTDTGVAEHGQLDAMAFADVALANPGSDEDEKTDQHADDLKVEPAPVSSARWAYLLYQAPVMVAVHGAELLGNDTYGREPEEP